MKNTQRFVCMLSGKPVPAPPKGSMSQVPQRSQLPVPGLPTSSSLQQGLRLSGRLERSAPCFRTQQS